MTNENREGAARLPLTRGFQSGIHGPNAWSRDLAARRHHCRRSMTIGWQMCVELVIKLDAFLRLSRGMNWHQQEELQVLYRVCHEGS